MEASYNKALSDETSNGLVNYGSNATSRTTTSTTSRLYSGSTLGKLRKPNFHKRNLLFLIGKNEP